MIYHLLRTIRVNVINFKPKLIKFSDMKLSEFNTSLLCLPFQSLTYAAHTDVSFMSIILDVYTISFLLLFCTFWFIFLENQIITNKIENT